MVSEVNGSNSSSVVTALEQRALKVDKTAAPTGAQGPFQQSADVVKLTDLASRLQELTQAVAEIPEIDRERVNTFREAIANGAYQVDAKAVADKLVGFESVLSGAPKV